MRPIVQDIIDRLGRRRALVLVLVGVGSLVAIWAFAHWATAPNWVPLYTGLSLDVVGDVTARLDEAGIAYRLERGGSELYVAEDDYARARVLLARVGLPTRSRPGFELFDQPAWGMTDFTQRVNYRRAIEGELERTISQMRGIEAAQVHLAMAESRVFRRAERPAEASVFLKLRPGAEASQEMVEAIRFLVASSVEGLQSENVTVLNDRGRLLSVSAEGGSTDLLTKRQLEYQREIERRLEEKAEELVAQVVGIGNVNVRVSASINFDRVERTTQSVDPGNQVVLQEQRSEIVPGPNTEGAGSVVANTTYDVTRQIETYSGGVGTIERLTVAVLVNDRIVVEGDSVRMVPRTEDELRQVEALVRNAVGLRPERGDAITVVSTPFDPRGTVMFARDEGPGILGWLRMFQRPLIGLVAAVLMFILAWRVIRALLPAEPAATPLAVAAGGPAGSLPGEGEVEVPAHPAIGDGRSRVREQVTDLLSRRPDNAVRVLRAWLRD